MSADPIARLAALLARLPSIGEKSAQRLAFHLATCEPDYLAALSTAVSGIGRSMHECSACRDISPDKVCSICSDARRDPSIVCVVAHPQDRAAIERASAFRGTYHVLHGLLDPLAGVGPAQLRIAALLERLRVLDGADAIAEVIVATNPSVSGDATAMYLARLLNPLGVLVTRIASGVAVGGELEYADPNTLTRALADRRSMGQP